MSFGGAGEEDAPGMLQFHPFSKFISNSAVENCPNIKTCYVIT